jgi:hypothetical protein
MRYLIFSILTLLSFGTLAQDADFSSLCVNSKAAQIYSVRNNTLDVAGFKFALACEGKPELILLQKKDWNSKSYDQQKLPTDSFHRLLLKTETHGSPYDIINYAKGESWKTQENVSLGFFAGDAVSPQCKSQFEIFAVKLTLTADKRLRPEAPIPSGICNSVKNEINNEFGLGQGITVLDYTLSTDKPGSFPTVAKSVRVVLIGSDPQNESEGFRDTSKLLIIDFDPLTNAIVLKAELKGEKFFGGGCGHYLMGARLLPHKDELVLAYRDPRLVKVDYSKPRQLVTNELMNADDPNTARTCEGLVISYDVLRNGPEQLIINEFRKTLIFTYYDLKSNDLQLFRYKLQK